MGIHRGKRVRSGDVTEIDHRVLTLSRFVPPSPPLTGRRVAPEMEESPTQRFEGSGGPSEVA